MKSSKRNFFILLAVPIAVFYGSSLVVSTTAVPIQESKNSPREKQYLRSLQLQLLKAVQEKRFSEAEMFFRRISKMDKVSAMVQRLGSVALYHNGKLNECEKQLRNLLLRNPKDFICRNNYAMVLMAKKRPQALAEFVRACEDSRRSSFIEKNLLRCAGEFKAELPRGITGLTENTSPVFTGVPVDAIVFEEENK